MNAMRGRSDRLPSPMSKTTPPPRFQHFLADLAVLLLLMLFGSNERSLNFQSVMPEGIPFLRGGHSETAIPAINVSS